ncbi:hypothetical protein [Bounagaea algeriensis]
MSEYLPPPPEAGMYHHLLPPEWTLDPIDATWMRGLIASALELRLTPMCWHIERDEHGAAVATGYVTVTRQHEADEIRVEWAKELGLHDDGAGGYTGRTGGLSIRLPDAFDPDEHCQVCGGLLDPRSTEHPPDESTYDRHVECTPRV